MSIISLSLKFSIDCAHCGNTLPVNKAAERMLCSGCGEETLIPLALWQKLVTKHLIEASTFKPETDTWANGILGGVGSYSMVFGKMLPRCAGCGGRSIVCLKLLKKDTPSFAVPGVAKSGVCANHLCGLTKWYPILNSWLGKNRLVIQVARLKAAKKE